MAARARMKVPAMRGHVARLAFVDGRGDEPLQPQAAPSGLVTTHSAVMITPAATFTRPAAVSTG